MLNIICRNNGFRLKTNEGKTLGLTIMLETGPISRFAQVGNYCSYCRKVSSKWISNDKKKGKANKKSSNKCLAWAFSEAAEIARRYYPEARSQGSTRNVPFLATR